MKLKNLISLFLLCSGASMPLCAVANVCANSFSQTVLSESDLILKKKEVKDLQKKYKLASPKASENEVNAALMQLKIYQLKRIDAKTVEGPSLPSDKDKITIQQVREMVKLLRVLAAAALTQGGEAKEDFYLYLDYLFTTNMLETIPKLKYNSYDDVRKLPVELLSALPACDDARKSRLISGIQHLLEADQLYLDDEKIKTEMNSDYIYNVIPHLFACAIQNPDEEQAVKDLLAFSHYLSACTQYTTGGYDILKPDGTGFHHKTHYNGYMYSYRTWVEYMSRLKGTSFRIEKDAYYRMSKAIISLYLMAVRSDSDNNRYFANSMAGRHPFTGLGVNFSQKLFESLIEVGGDILGMPYEPELASYYNYFYQTNKYKDVPEMDADGFYQFNYSPAGVYRHANWVAVMRCPTTNFWGGELYSKTNRFGRYQSHGTLEVLYEGGQPKAGYPENNDKKGAGWDWNMMPGSTTVHYTDWKAMMPNKNDADRFDQKSVTTNFAGALAWKDCGLFAAAFDQGDHWGSRRFEATNLTFCKSVFAIDGMLFSLGTGVSAKGTYPDEWITATNLFQAIISKDSKELVVDGKEIQKGQELILDSSKAAWMVTPATTGFFVPKGHDKLVIKYEEQKTPSSVGMTAAFGQSIAAKAYIHHGVKPEKKNYQFMVVPATTSQQMKELARKQEKNELFEVLVSQDSLHVVKHLPSATTAYALFAPTANLSKGILCASATELLVMERIDKAKGKLNLALCNPNLRPAKDGNTWVATSTEASIELKGLWVKENDRDRGVSLEKNERGNTVLKTTLTEGSPVYVSLVKSGKMIK